MGYCQRFFETLKFLKGELTIETPMDVLIIAIHFSLMFIIGFFFTKSIGVDYDKTASPAFTAAGNNFELAIG